MRLLGTIIVWALGTAALVGQTAANPVEVGDVRWGRDFDAALGKSAASGKPVLVLFQEVPG